MVRILQQALEASGNSPGTIDSLFGTKTQAALRAFQRSARLPETGVANRDTWLAIAPFINYDNVYLRRGDRGMLVVILQTALYNAGFDPGRHRRRIWHAYPQRTGGLPEGKGPFS